MPEKYLRVTMPDGSKWDVPAHLIAEDRARYYADKEPVGPGRSATYLDELNATLSDSYELTDWAANNMNWSDVAKRATRASGPDDVDYQEGWVNGDKEIVEL
jgi:hypothetical protein